MKKLIILVISFIIISYVMAFSQPLAKPDVKMKMTAKKVAIIEQIVDGRKEKKETFGPAEKAFPGDIVEYDLTYWNEGDGAANNLSIIGPIPYNTMYVGNTATKLKDAELKYSIDRFFKITEESFAKFADHNVSKEIVDKLRGLKDREYESEDEFEKTLNELIGEKEATLYKPIILSYSEDKNKPKTYKLPPIKYIVKETDEKGVEKEVEKIATPDMYTSIQWVLQRAFNAGEKLTLSYRVKIK